MTLRHGAGQVVRSCSRLPVAAYSSRSAARSCRQAARRPSSTVHGVRHDRPARHPPTPGRGRLIGGLVAGASCSSSAASSPSVRACRTATTSLARCPGRTGRRPARAAHRGGRRPSLRSSDRVAATSSSVPSFRTARPPAGRLGRILVEVEVGHGPYRSSSASLAACSARHRSSAPRPGRGRPARRSPAASQPRRKRLQVACAHAPRHRGRLRLAQPAAYVLASASLIRNDSGGRLDRGRYDVQPRRRAGGRHVPLRAGHGLRLVPADRGHLAADWLAPVTERFREPSNPLIVSSPRCRFTLSIDTHQVGRLAAREVPARSSCLARFGVTCSSPPA